MIRNALACGDTSARAGAATSVKVPAAAATATITLKAALRKLWISSPPATVRALPPDGADKTYTESDLFECPIRVRLDLEAQGLLLSCQGTRRLVLPSGMSRQMSDGRKAYRLSPGRRASDDDLVDIFAPAECSDVVTVDEQRATVAEFFADRRGGG